MKKVHRLFGDPETARLLDTSDPATRRDVSKGDIIDLPHIPGPQRIKVAPEGSIPPRRSAEIAAEVREPKMLPDVEEDSTDADTEK